MVIAKSAAGGALPTAAPFAEISAYRYACDIPVAKQVLAGKTDPANVTSLT